MQLQPRGSIDAATTPALSEQSVEVMQIVDASESQPPIGVDGILTSAAQHDAGDGAPTAEKPSAASNRYCLFAKKPKSFPIATRKAVRHSMAWPYTSSPRAPL